jgi:hypothetical protein
MPILQDREELEELLALLAVLEELVLHPVVMLILELVVMLGVEEQQLQEIHLLHG